MPSSLATAGKKETLDAVFQALDEDQPQYQIFLEWVSQGNLSFVEWVCQQDDKNKDLLYQQLRTLTPFRLQETSLLLYRNLSRMPEAQKACLEWALQCEDREESLAKLLYLQAHDPEALTQIVKEGNFNTIEKRLTHIDLLGRINSRIAAIADEAHLSIGEKALKTQFQFAVAAADMLVNQDGSINKTLIPELKKSNFFLENKARKTTVYKYLDRVFALLEFRGEFSERLAKGAVMPIPGSPAFSLVKQTLGKSTIEEFNQREVQVVLLSCLLQRPWQSPNVASCFGTSIVIQSQSTEALLLQSLDDYLALVKNNGLQRGTGKTSIQYPLSIRLETGSFEHPFVKAREYCISSMASSEQGQMLRSNNISGLFDDNTGIIPMFLNAIARKKTESYSAIQSLQNKLKQEFLDRSLELYDSLLKNENRPEGERVQGGWVIGNRTTYELINTQEKYEQFLLHMIEEVEKAGEFSLVQEAFAILKQKILSHELSELVKAKIAGCQPWANRTGAVGDILLKIYYDHAPLVESIKTMSENYRDDLKGLYTYAQLLSTDAAAKEPESRIPVKCPGHQYSLIRSKLTNLQSFNTFEELESSLEETSKSFGNILINQKLEEAWINSLCSFPSISKDTGERLRNYLKKHPIKRGPLREFGWKLTDAVMRVSTSQEKKSVAMIVEQAILNLEELQKEQPQYIIIGDYNWFSDAQDTCYAAYASSPFTGKIEPYRIGEEGRNFTPQYRLNYGISIQGQISEQSWKPLK